MCILLHPCLKNPLTFDILMFLIVTVIIFDVSRGLRLHRSTLQLCVCVLGPMHVFPPFEGGGLVQVRLRSCVPPSHVLLHAPQVPQRVKRPSTAKQFQRMFIIEQDYSAWQFGYYSRHHQRRHIIPQMYCQPPPLRTKHRSSDALAIIHYWSIFG